MSLTDIAKWIVGETNIFLAPQVVLGRKDADCNLRQRSRTVSSLIWRSATWALRIIPLASAMILLLVGAVPVQPVQPVQPTQPSIPGTPSSPAGTPSSPGGTPPSPSITVNGASGGTTVSAGASMSVTVGNGPGNATDWMGVCNAGVPISSTQCNGAGYSWDYLNCTQTAPTTGLSSATCGLTAPSAAGNYNAVFFSTNTYTVLASAPFTVTGGGGGGGGSVTVVQTLTDHGVNSALANGTQRCVWQFSQPIHPGDTVVGYVHTANDADTTEMYPRAITDNAGHTYALSPGVHWVPFPEDIGIWYLTNIQGNPNTFIFDYTQYPASGNTVLDFCDVGFAEYSGATSLTVVNPVLVYGTSPSMTISPTGTSLIWAFASPFGYPTNAALDGAIQNPGYSVIIENGGDDMDVWGSNSVVPAGPLTLDWYAPMGSPGTCFFGSTPGPGNGCPTVVMGAAVQQ